MGGGRERERLLEGSKLMPAMSTVRLRAVVVGRRREGEGEEKGRRRGGVSTAKEIDYHSYSLKISDLTQS